MILSGQVGQLEYVLASSGIAGVWVTRDKVQHMPNYKGAYILLIRLSKPVDIGLPRLDPTQLKPGWYAYAGSAWGSRGIRARIKRHFKTHKALHWHIDRLTVNATDIAALALAAGHECQLASKLLGSSRFNAVAAGFGCTDCRSCESHLLKSSII